MKPSIKKDGSVEVDMGLARLKADQIPTTLRESTFTCPDKKTEQVGVVDAALICKDTDPSKFPMAVALTCVSMGNPHCVIFVPNVDNVDLARIGP